MRTRTYRLLLPALLALSLFVAACDTGGTTETTTVVSDETTTTVETTTTTTTQPGEESTGPIVTAGVGVSDEVVAQLTTQIAELVNATEQVRGLPFLAQPIVSILSPEELEARVRADLAEEIDPDSLAVDSRLLKLMGLLQPGDDLETMLIDLYGEQVAGFYDGETREMVIGGEASELTPYTRSVVVHELIHALTDQHFLFYNDYEAMWEEERYEEASAFQALIEGDATYFQFIYMQELPLAEQLALATEALQLLEDSSAADSVPDWLINDISFPYESGQVFVESLVSSGGIAAVDQAYTDRPITTEVVMHPSRYAAGEGVLPIPPLEIELDGYEVHETSSYGEWGFRVLLDGSAAPGVSAQAANGWGGDEYQVLYDNDDVVFALAYKGDTEEDAFELADALITYAGETLAMGDGLGDDGGITFRPDDGRYAHLDRIGDGFIFVLSTDAGAGSAAADQMRIP
ncbi:MAG: hypothetical protein QNJ75_05165 [Acidimicrobiia bacterium]|nr:hypothetical protein [Acidimicrobiia bacterium]